MKVLEQFNIKGRGRVLTLTPLEADYPIPDLSRLRLRRFVDGSAWRVRGIERFAVGRSAKLYEAENVGLLVEDGCELQVGDEVELFTEES